MDSDLEPLYLRITQAEHPEEIFGCEDIVLPVDTLLTYLGREHDKLKADVSPAKFQDPVDREAAAEASALLLRHYQEAERRIRMMVYGMKGLGETPPAPAGRTFSVGDRAYRIGAAIGKGEHTTLYDGYLEQQGIALGEVVIKLANAPEKGPRILRERRLLEVLHSKDVPQWRHLPFVLDRFQAGERLGLVFRKAAGVTLAEARRHSEHRRGIDQKHVVWMLDRLLSALGYIHAMGIVHGSLIPEHVLVQPKVHNIVIVGGWGSAAGEPATTGERIADKASAFSPPEVLGPGPLGPWTDIYTLGKLMIWLLGGDPVEKSMPAEVEQPLQAFILDMVEERASRRPADAWELYHVQNELKDSLWPRKFIPFNLS